MKFKSFALITGIAVSEFVFTAAFSSADAMAMEHYGSIMFTPDPNGNMVTQSFTGSFKFASEEFILEPEWFEVTEFSVKTPLSQNTYTLGQLVSANKLLFNPSTKQLAGFTFVGITRCATKNDRIRVLDDNLMVLISESLANQDQKTSCT
ncbi:MAG: hypothetical protein ACKO2V_03865, partial [Snowella sp.]